MMMSTPSAKGEITPQRLGRNRRNWNGRLGAVHLTAHLETRAFATTGTARHLSATKGYGESKGQHRHPG
jgi:hypothetical protein